MTKPTPHIRRGAFIIIFVALASALLCALAMSWYYDRIHRWNHIVSPADEAVTEIVALNRGLMPYVKTQQGNLYFCSGSTWRDTCTPITEVELPISEVHPKWLTCPPPFPQTPPLPGAVVDAYEVGQCAEAKTYAKVILLDDGTLWLWRRTYSWVQPFTIGTAALMGLGIGFLSGLVIVNTRRYLRTPPPVLRI